MPRDRMALRRSPKGPAARRRGRHHEEMSWKCAVPHRWRPARLRLSPAVRRPRPCNWMRARTPVSCRSAPPAEAPFVLREREAVFPAAVGRQGLVRFPGVPAPCTSITVTAAVTVTAAAPVAFGSGVPVSSRPDMFGRILSPWGTSPWPAPALRPGAASCRTWDSRLPDPIAPRNRRNKQKLSPFGHGYFQAKSACWDRATGIRQLVPRCVTKPSQKCCIGITAQA
jgi:hypothetical protein